MAIVKTFVSRIKTPWGDDYPQAVIGITHVDTISRGSNSAESITGEVKITEGEIIGGTFTASFFNSGTTQAQGLPDRPVVHIEDGVETEVFIIDIEDAQVKQIQEGSLSPQEKRDNIARLQLIKHFR